MQLREYIPSDCAQMAELFYQTVHSVNTKDYKKEQLDAWATGEVDLQAWDASFRAHRTVIATENGEIIGFGDMDENSYLDRLYVHKDHQGQGIASAICDELECFATGKTITAHASITAKSFFQHRGYRVVRQQEVIRRGVALTNFVMKKQPERTK